MKKTIDKDSPLSLYYQLKQIIINMIENRELKENEKILTEKELCEKYEISRVTVRQALKELENEDYIYKMQGKGTFVSPKKIQQNLLKFYSFTNEMKKIGKKPKSKVLDFKINITEQKKVLDVLGIENSEEVYQFSRLRLADGFPMMVETTYLPQKYFPGIVKNDLESEPLYDILINKFNVVFSKAEEIFRATLINEEEARQLEFIKGGPGIILERITYNNRGQAIEYTKSIARGDKFKYHVELKK